VKKYNIHSQTLIRELLSQALHNSQMATPKDKAALREVWRRVESLPVPTDAPEPVGYAETAEETKRRHEKAKHRQSLRETKAAAEAEYRRQVEAVDQAWRAKFEANGLLPASRELEHVRASGHTVGSQCDQYLKKIQSAMKALDATWRFAESIGVILRVPVAGNGHDLRQLLRKPVPLPAVHFKVADVIVGEENGIVLTAKSWDAVRHFLQSLPR
jgi:hypothetical protein